MGLVFQVDRNLWPKEERLRLAVGRVPGDGAGQPARVSGLTLDVTRQQPAAADLPALNAGAVGGRSG